MKRQMKRLLKRDNYICHYCKRMTDALQKSRYPTKDHIVPRSLGGENHLDNYVLACLYCNNDRGTSLFYCDCTDCMEKIFDALYDPESLGRMFNGMINHNKPRIHRRNLGACGRAGGLPWSVRIGHAQKTFYTFEEALEFALNGTFVKDKIYE